MKIAVTGSTGLIGTALVADLRRDGHEVLRLVRREPAAPDEAGWDPAARTVQESALIGVDAVVHLAGAGIGDRRWTEGRKRVILRSRVDGTAAIASAVARMHVKPRVLVSASAIGYYGDTGDRPVDERATNGTGFAAEVAQAWEGAADPARSAGVRVVHPRSGLVMAATGGAWARMLPLFRLGLGGPLGGDQYWSYITLRDEVRALRFLIDRAELTGAVNLTAPQPATNAQISSAMAAALHRPAVLKVPPLLLRAVLGELSAEVLASTRVIPAKLAEAGFQWEYPDLQSAVATLV